MPKAKPRQAPAADYGPRVSTVNLEWSPFAHCWVQVDRNGNVVAAWDELLRPIDLQPGEAPNAEG